MVKTAEIIEKTSLMFLIFLFLWNIQKVHSMHLEYPRQRFPKGCYEIDKDGVVSCLTNSLIAFQIPQVNLKKSKRLKRIGSAPLLSKKKDQNLLKKSDQNKMIHQKRHDLCEMLELFLPFYADYLDENQHDFFLFVHRFLYRDQISSYPKEDLLYAPFHAFLLAAMDPKACFYIRDYDTFRQTYQTACKNHYAKMVGWDLCQKEEFQKTILHQIKKKAAQHFNHFASILTLFQNIYAETLIKKWVLSPSSLV